LKQSQVAGITCCERSSNGQVSGPSNLSPTWEQSIYWALLALADFWWFECSTKTAI